jgi:hypothetical protein
MSIAESSAMSAKEQRMQLILEEAELRYRHELLDRIKRLRLRLGKRS